MEKRFLVQIENTEYDIVVRQDGAEYAVRVNDNERRVSLADGPAGTGSAHALIDTWSYQALLTQRNGSWSVFTTGKHYSATVANYQLAQLKKRLGVKSVQTMSRVLKSPMPGLVLQVNVAEGETVEAGDTILVLEAMKMENPIKSSGAGIVSKIHVRPKDSVEKGVTLIEFAE